MSRRQLRTLIGSILFIAIVAVSGFVLAQSGDLDNPFNVFSRLTSLVSSTDQDTATGGTGRMDGQRPPGGSGDMSEGRPEGGERGDQASIQWSRIGGVLSNLWFIAALTAVVMIVGRPLGSMMKWLSRGTASIRPKAVS